MPAMNRTRTVSPAANPDDAGGPELRKPHEMVVLMPRSKRVTLTGRLLYNAMLQVAQSRLMAFQGMPPADHLFEAPLPALLRTTGSNGEDRTAAKRYLREMRGLEVDWESTAPGDGVKWRGFSMLSEVAIEVRGGENWVSWSYPPTIMAALREPARWARIDLDVLAQLGTYTAVALYEICARYRDNPSGVTSRKPVQWWVNALSQAPAGSERREWRKFKSERVKEAIEEINQNTDLDVELIEHKQGRAVQEVQFAVRRKHTLPHATGQAAAPVDAHLVLRAESLGIREMKLEGLLREFGADAVRVQLEVLERRHATAHLRHLDHPYAYLRSLLRLGVSADLAEPPELPRSPVAGLAVEEPVPTPTAAVPPTSATARPPPPVAGAAPAVPAGLRPGVPMPAPVQVADTWLDQRMAAVKAELAALPAEQRQFWVAQAMKDLAERRLLSAVITRRAAQGDVLHGMLGAVLVRLYATATHGPGWDLPPA